jgi:tRNA A37 threonylcarbamoyladenosine biosynthesis protein TsaE
MIIGQKRAQRFGRLVLASGKNLMLVAPSGHGKSLLARDLAGGIFLSLEYPDPPMDILELFEWKNRRVVCDEIHLCTKQDEWALFCDSFEGAVIFTTTVPEKVLESIRTRTILIELDPYTQKELVEISGVLGRPGKIIAKLSRGIPRRAKNLGIIYNQFDGTIQDFLELMEVQERHGVLLFPEELQFLEILKDGPVAKANIQRILNLANIEEVELSLLRLGLIRVTGRGRELVP